MWKTFRSSILALGFLTLLTGIVYPLAVTVIAQMFFPRLANGSFVEHHGKIVGSELIGQSFSKPEYFWGRLSATSPVAYNATASSGSNFGPLHPDLAKNASERIQKLKTYDDHIGKVPVDFVTASGSGLDPHISPLAATVQVQRVAKARKMTEQEVQRLVALHTEGRQLGILGEPRVNVLTLNLALDAQSFNPSAP